MNPSQHEPRFLTYDEVIAIHFTSIDTFGGSDGVLDRGKLESALAQPAQQFNGEHLHSFPFGMAAAYVYHIAMNHPFHDGNKRTAFAAMVAFLDLNGWQYDESDGNAADLVLSMIEQGKTKEVIAEAIEKKCRPQPS